MKKILPFLGGALGLALLVTGCESDSSSRVQEKPAVYAGLKPWQKKYVDTGVIAMGFSPDMVYLAIGNPTDKKPAEGGEVWIYKNYYPSVAADQVKRTLNADTTMDHTLIGGTQMESTGVGNNTQIAGSNHGGGRSPAATSTGGPQGGSIEPADLQSYTLYVGFRNNAVVQMKLDPN